MYPRERFIKPTPKGAKGLGFDVLFSTNIVRDPPPPSQISGRLCNQQETDLGRSGGKHNPKYFTLPPVKEGREHGDTQPGTLMSSIYKHPPVDSSAFRRAGYKVETRRGTTSFHLLFGTASERVNGRVPSHAGSAGAIGGSAQVAGTGETALPARHDCYDTVTTSSPRRVSSRHLPVTRRHDVPCGGTGVPSVRLRGVNAGPGQSRLLHAACCPPPLALPSQTASRGVSAKLSAFGKTFL